VAVTTVPRALSLALSYAYFSTYFTVLLGIMNVTGFVVLAAAPWSLFDF
jgi:hypothetical protein